MSHIDRIRSRARYLKYFKWYVYSLGGKPDKALIEQRVEFSSAFSDISYQGIPDNRTIVFRGIPVMSMIRLPTRASAIKANLHQGAIGVGVDLATGLNKKGVWRESVIIHYPDTGVAIEGVTIPHWETITSLSSSCYELVTLGYIGGDIVLDANHGPLILEVNARPDLSVQIANPQGLLPHLKAVEEFKTFLMLFKHNWKSAKTYIAIKLQYLVD